MGYPDDYPDHLKRSIFAWSGDDAGDPGSMTFVFTRGGGRLNVYVLQYLGNVDGRDMPGDAFGGDVVFPCAKGTIGDLHYNPHAEGSDPPADMHWDSSGDAVRLSQPVRRWLSERDYMTADRETLLRMVASEKRFELHDTTLR